MNRSTLLAFSFCLALRPPTPGAFVRPPPLAPLRSASRATHRCAESAAGKNEVLKPPIERLAAALVALFGAPLGGGSAKAEEPASFSSDAELPFVSGPSWGTWTEVLANASAAAAGGSLHSFSKGEIIRARELLPATGERVNSLVTALSAAISNRAFLLELGPAATTSFFAEAISALDEVASAANERAEALARDVLPSAFNGTAESFQLDSWQSAASAMRYVVDSVAAALPSLPAATELSAEALELSALVCQQLKELTEAHDVSTVVFYNSPTASVRHIPADFRFQLSQDAFDGRLSMPQTLGHGSSNSSSAGWRRLLRPARAIRSLRSRASGRRRAKSSEVAPAGGASKANQLRRRRWAHRLRLQRRRISSLVRRRPRSAPRQGSMPEQAPEAAAAAPPGSKPGDGWLPARRLLLALLTEVERLQAAAEGRAAGTETPASTRGAGALGADLNEAEATRSTGNGPMSRQQIGDGAELCGAAALLAGMWRAAEMPGSSQPAADSPENGPPFYTQNATTGSGWGQYLQLGQRRLRHPVWEDRLLWRDAMTVLERASPIQFQANYPLLLHSCLLMALAPYNIERWGAPEVQGAAGVFNRDSKPRRPAVRVDRSEEAEREAFGLLVLKALGADAAEGLEVHSVASDKACALVAVAPALKVVLVSFRGTKDVVDVITDLNFTLAPFAPAVVALDGAPQAAAAAAATAAAATAAAATAAAATAAAATAAAATAAAAMSVHRGFGAAFDSIKEQVSAFVESSDAKRDKRVCFVGHSMGGALATLAAAHFGHLNPTLVTFAAPPVGDAAFCAHVQEVAHPHGGLRVFNEGDAVPAIAQLIGFYQHVGVPVVQTVTEGAVAKYRAENINVQLPGLRVVAPHILFQLGPALYAFPVLGTELPQEAGEVEV